MCGIVGSIHFNGFKHDLHHEQVSNAAKLIRYRGPDAQNVYVDEHVALGHCRLSIIDLSSGSQPMHTREGDLHVVFNGEIYNFPELRKELETAGHVFQTTSDTEIILLGYRQWGDAVVEKLYGMFAFVLWDSKQRRVIMARDRVGKKPLYYWQQGDHLVFASELKALLALIPNTPEIDPRALDCYLSFGYVPSPMSIYQGIHKLLPAHFLTSTGAGCSTDRYWDLHFKENSSLTIESAIEEYESLLDQATRCRLMSEVPLGAFLSGGIDSSLVVAAMSEAMNKPVLTNTIGFSEDKFNELPLARMISNQLGTDHHEFTLEADVVDVLPRIAYHFDEPLADSSAVPTWYVCQMARRNVTVALSGDGGDESFAGYSFRYNPHLTESRIRNKIPMALRALVFGPLASVYPQSTRLPRYLRLKSYLENMATSDAEAFYQDLIWLRRSDRQQLYSSAFISQLSGYEPLEEVYPKYSGPNGHDPLSRAQYTDINFYMTEDVLVKVDRMSMAHSLEVRAPLLDHRLLEFAATLPVEMKIKQGQGKWLMRQVAKKRYPEKIINHPKQGFSIPAASWLRKELKEIAADKIFNSTVIQNYLNQQQVQRLWNEHQSGKQDHNVLLWGLMMLGFWEGTS